MASHGHGAIEVAKTVLEVAEVAWSATECYHHHHDHNKTHDHADLTAEEELQSARCENQRLRDLLEQNLKLLQNLSESPSFAKDCPPDLHDRLVTTIESKRFLERIDNLKQANEKCNEFPFREATGADLQSAEILINIDQEKPSWVWVTDEMVPSNVEARSGIDDENYVVITEDHVVDGVANFMARCIIANPKAQRLSPEELQKTLSKALAGVSKVEKMEQMINIWHAGKLFYALSTWGLALTGLYRSRAVIKFAAIGAHKTGKLILKAL